MGPGLWEEAPRPLRQSEAAQKCDATFTLDKGRPSAAFPRLGGGLRRPPRQEETAEERGQTGCESGSSLAPNWLTDLELTSVNSLEKHGSD